MSVQAGVVGFKEGAECMTARDAMTDLQHRMEASIIGQRDVIRQMLVGLLANGHLPLESLPGLAKTLSRSGQRAGHLTARPERRGAC